MLRRAYPAALLLAALAAAGAARAVGEPLVVVYPFECGDGVSLPEAERLGAPYGALLTSTGKYRVLHGHALEVELAAVGLRVPALPKADAEAVKAARAVGAAYAVLGKAFFADGRYTLETALIDVAQGRGLRTVRSHVAGTLEEFVRSAPARNIQALFKLENPPGPPAGPGRAAGAAGLPDTGGGDAEAAINRVHEHVAGHLEVGSRMLYVHLFSNHRDSFVGTVDSLDVQQDYLPLKLFVDWMITPQVGIELSWDYLDVDMVSSTQERSDGDLGMRGPSLSAVGRYTNPTRATPYATIGVAYFQGEFDSEPWWSMGYQSPADWEAAGKPYKPHDGIRRYMDISDAVALHATVGCDLKLNDVVSVDAGLRFMRLEVEDHLYVLQNDKMLYERGTSTIPLSNLAFGLGVRYAF